MLTTARSLIHMFAEDGGAETIAGLSIDGALGENLVHIFSQWGLEQLIIAIFGWVIITRYRFLVPFVLLMQLFDWTMRWVMGELNPLDVDDPPPGEIGNYIFVPLCAIALWFLAPQGH